MLLRLPGVYPPQADSFFLAQALQLESIDADTRVLDLCTGTGVLSVQAASAGARDITAVDIGRRALTTAWINGRLNRVPIRVARGDLTAPVRNSRFDLVLSNPPYVPAEDDALPTRGLARCWDAGQDGRALLDRICVEAPDVLAPGGVLLLLQSALSGVEKTQAMLEEQGLDVEIVARTDIPFGPVMSMRRELLRRRGLIDELERREQLVVFRAVK
ncbi:methyltransferase domain-containing protein [Rhodococcus sp. ABRD24]|uniref:HemK2/MTQ2 family protein methyltransferase n=1 Tax=Rhodococcus sp. ABRD24 TaxID=2507582 RepID=UPI00103BEAEE|nr:HemK2/MTQ2 family protein methyltransferase [Rhodococcus sp. ABRD24]QBJ95959.1 methyltransferase domain-containing protein [Rhodococcus sp. ABRD24]